MKPFVFSSLTLLSTALFLELALMGSDLPVVNAQPPNLLLRPGLTTAQAGTGRATKNRFQIANLRAPGNREGGATRGGCVTANTQHLTALMPEGSSGRTISPYPTLYFYVPTIAEHQAELQLRDLDSGKSLYRQQVTVAQTPGIIAVSLPTEQAPLEVERLYQWQFRLICDPGDRERDLVVSGVVQRVLPSADLAQQLATAPPTRKPTLFEQAGIWYEALQSTVELRHSDSSLATQQWTALLQEVGLAAIAEKPLTSCCR